MSKYSPPIGIELGQEEDKVRISKGYHKEDIVRRGCFR